MDDARLTLRLSQRQQRFPITLLFLIQSLCALLPLRPE